MRRCAWGWLLLAAGCGGQAAPAPSEAAAAALRFFTALKDQEWPAAYAALSAGGREQVTLAELTERARRYRNAIGFEPAAAHVRSCDERGDEAVAHVSLTGQAGGRQRFHKDAVTLRRGPDGWGVVLPPRFGRGRP